MDNEILNKDIFNFDLINNSIWQCNFRDENRFTKYDWMSLAKIWWDNDQRSGQFPNIVY